MSRMEDDPDVLAVVGMPITYDDDEDEYDDESCGELTAPPPPDGGFGWIIVVASLICNVIVDGVCFSFGIFNVAFIEHYNSSKSEMAWVGSLLAGFYLTMGPITSALCNRYGCRKVTVVGSVLCFFAFFLSTFATSVSLLILTYGAMGGITFGLVYLPAIVIVGQWFEKRRALASGLAVCGSGIGAFLFAPLSRFLLVEYGLKGANWIIAAICLNGVVCGSLFRSVDEAYAYEHKRREDDVTDDPDDDNVKGLLQRMATAKRDRKITLHGDEDRISATGEYVIRWDAEGFGDKPPTLGLRPNRSFISQKSFGSGSRPSLLLGGSRPISLLVKSNKSLAQSVVSKSRQRAFSRPASNKSLLVQDQQNSKRMKISEVDITKTHNSFNPNPSRSRTITALSLNNNNNTRGKNNGDYSGNPWDDCTAQNGEAHPSITGEPIKNKELPVLSRRELFFAGSMNQIPYIGSRADIKTNVVSMHSLHQAASRPEGINSKAQPGLRGLLSNALTTFVVMMDLSLLKSPVFLLLCVSSFFCMTGFFVPFFFLPSYAIDTQMSGSDGDFVLQMIGVANTFARIGAGYLADLPWVDGLVLNIGALFVGGVATMLIPFCTNRATLSVYGLVFGTSIAVFVSLRTPILADLLGPKRMASSFGLSILFQGIASIIGSPLAGMVYDKTQTYDAVFYFSGGLIALSGFLLIPVRCVQRLEERKVLESLNPGASVPPSVPPSAAESSAATPRMKTRTGSLIPDILFEEPTVIDEEAKTEHEVAVKESLAEK